MFQVDDSVNFGLIDCFIALTEEGPTALIYKLQFESDSILQRAGHPCRDVLQQHKDINLLSTYIVPVKYQTTTLTAVKVEKIQGKLVMIKTGINFYAVVQPNSFEHH